MSTDLDRALSDAAAHLDDTAPPITVDEILNAHDDPEHAVLIPLTRTVPTRRRPLLFVAAVAAIAALVAGVVAINSSRDSSSVSDQPGETAPARPGDLPATGVVFAPEDALAVSVAQDTLISECMADKGFDYPLPTTDELIAAFGEWQPHAVLGIQRAGAARRVGYHSVGVGGFGTPSQTSAIQLLDAGQREAFGIALEGPELAAATPPDAATEPDTGRVNAGGCLGQVQATALNNDEELRAAVNEAGKIGEMAPSGAGFDDAALHNPRVRNALDTWSTCVETRTGEQADTPNELARRFLDSNYDDSATAEVTRNRLGTDAELYDDWTRARVETINSARATLTDRNIALPSLD
jgi:hypothetical protein